MPGSTATGELGGPIYDVVFRLQVPAGYVILAGLTGTPGTDFDLYLFDSSATTVLGTTGLLAKSTGPTSSEQLSWPTRIGGTFYLDMNGASDVQGTYNLTVQMVPDPTPPTARLLVAGGQMYVKTPEVMLQLLGFDDLSGITEMSLSADGINYLPPVPLQSQFSWSLSDGDGPKTIWARVYNGVGLASAPATVTVVVDTVGPVPLAVTPAANSIVSTARPRISVAFNESIDATTWLNQGLVVQAADGTILPGTYAIDAATNTGFFTPSAELAPGYVYIVTVGDVRDLAGNRAHNVGSWTIKRLIPVSITIHAAPAVLVYGASTTLSGSTTGVPSTDTVSIDSREGAAPSYTSTATIGPGSGGFNLSVAPAKNTWYRVAYGGSAVATPAQASVRVLVRRSLAIIGTAASTIRTAAAGRAVTVTAQVGPKEVTSVSFRLYRYDSYRHSYVYVRSYGRTTNVNGSARLTWVPSYGRYAWRIATASTVDYANNLSALYRWSVAR